MSDLIKREDVLDVLRNLAFDHIFQCGEYYGEDERQLTIINAEKAIDVIESLPSAEPEQETGKWIEFPDSLQYDGAYSDDHIVCSECHHVFSILDNCTEEWKCCPNCGARLE